MGYPGRSVRDRSERPRRRAFGLPALCRCRTPGRQADMSINVAESQTNTTADDLQAIADQTEALLREWTPGQRGGTRLYADKASWWLIQAKNHGAFAGVEYLELHREFDLIHDSGRLDPYITMFWRVGRWLAKHADRLSINPAPPLCDSPEFLADEDAVRATVEAVACLIEREAQKSLPPRESAGPARDMDPVERELPPCQHSPDFRSVRWCGAEYYFTGNQAACVRELWKAKDKGTPDVGDAYLLETAEAADKTTVKQIFRDHPAWGIMIVQGKTKGTHRLDPPPAEKTGKI